jgi:hypothetical protein
MRKALWDEANFGYWLLKSSEFLRFISMSHLVFNLHRHSRRVCVAKSLPFSVPSQLIAKGLLVALLGTWGTQVNAQLPTELVVAQAQEASETSVVAQQLLGQWQAKDPDIGCSIYFYFCA